MYKCNHCRKLNKKTKDGKEIRMAIPTHNIDHCKDCLKKCLITRL